LDTDDVCYSVNQIYIYRDQVLIPLLGRSVCTVTKRTDPLVDEYGRYFRSTTQHSMLRFLDKQYGRALRPVQTPHDELLARLSDKRKLL
jgi:hypothetical protein